MEVQVQTTKNSHSPTSQSFVLGDHKIRATVRSPPAVGKVAVGAKLPPLSLDAAGDANPRNAILKQAKDEVQAVMKHLLMEAQLSESRIEKGMDCLWQNMLDIMEQRSQMYQQQLAAASADLEDSKGRIARLTAQEAALVQQNARASIQLVSEEKKRKELEFAMESMNKKLQSSKEEAQQLRKHSEDNEQKHKDELSKLQSQLEVKSSALREYQMTITRLTDKMNKLSKDFSFEKNSAEKQLKSNSDQLSRQVTENRKLALEISKLKAQLSTSNLSLTAAREETNKCELQLKSQQQEHEAKLSRFQKKFTSTIQQLEARIQSLEKELEDLKQNHRVETDALKKALMEAERNSSAVDDTDEFLEQRIKFLKHQNKQEKLKLMKDQKTSNKS